MHTNITQHFKHMQPRTSVHWHFNTKQHSASPNCVVLVWFWWVQSTQDDEFVLKVSAHHRLTSKKLQSFSSRAFTCRLPMWTRTQLKLFYKKKLNVCILVQLQNQNWGRSFHCNYTDIYVMLLFYVQFFSLTTEVCLINVDFK